MIQPDMQEEALKKWLAGPQDYAAVRDLLQAALRYHAAGGDRDVFLGVICIVMDWANKKAKAH